MKKNYEIPETLILQTEMDPVMFERVSQGEEVVVGPGDAKENKDVFIEQEETLPADKNIWEDDEE